MWLSTRLRIKGRSFSFNYVYTTFKNRQNLAMKIISDLGTDNLCAMKAGKDTKKNINCSSKAASLGISELAVHSGKSGFLTT